MTDEEFCKLEALLVETEEWLIGLADNGVLVPLDAVTARTRARDALAIVRAANVRSLREALNDALDER